MTTDERDLLPKDLLEKSASDREIALPFPDAVRAIRALEAHGISGIAYEGWVRYPDGTLGQHADYQGTTGYFAVEDCLRCMTDDQARWERSAEPGLRRELLFCLNADTRGLAECSDSGEPFDPSKGGPA